MKVTGGLTPEQEAALLVNQPPGTVIKAITAQVIQTPQGPRIVLQGLTGSDFTAQQLALVQQQVKQQLLKGTKLVIHSCFSVQTAMAFEVVTPKTYQLFSHV